MKEADPQNHDIVLVSGMGNTWPLLCNHNLLNNLHTRIGNTHLVIFYSGKERWFIKTEEQFQSNQTERFQKNPGKSNWVLGER